MVDKIGLKDYNLYHEPRIVVNVVGENRTFVNCFHTSIDSSFHVREDALGNRMEPEITTLVSNKRDEYQHIRFNETVNLKTPLQKIIAGKTSFWFA